MGYTFGYLNCECAEAVAAAEQAEFEEAQKRKQLEQEKRLKRYARAGIRKRFIDADTPCEPYVQQVLTGNGLYIYGKVGSGKTYLASAIAKQLMDQGKQVMFLPTVEVMTMIRATYDDHAQSEEAVLHKLCTCDVLVLDDLGKENQSQSGWVESILFRIVNQRYADMLPIIITTQFSSEALIKRLSRSGAETAVAIVSRLIEMCKGVHLNESDRRMERRIS